MAVYECDYGRHRYPQPQQTIYFTHVIGSLADTYRMRMCPTHFRQTLVELQDHMSEIDEDSKSSQDCEVCHEAKVGALFAKVFPAKEAERYFVVDLCADCLSALGNRLRIFNGSGLGRT